MTTNTVTNPNPFTTVGSQVTGETDLQKMLDAAGAGFRAIKLPSQSTIPSGDPNVAGFVVESDEACNIVRLDSREIIGSHGAKYHLQQYMETMRVAQEIVDLRKASGADAAIECVGTFDNGRKFFVNVSLGELIIDPQGIADKLGSHISGYSSHDGVLANFWREGNIRFWCNNVLPVLRDKGKIALGYYVKHTKNMPTRAEQAVSALLNGTGAMDLMHMQITNMLKVAATSATVKRMSEDIWSPPKADDKRSTTMAENRLDQIQDLFATEVNRVGSNGWAMYNAFTEWKDHFSTGGVEKRALASVMPFSNVEDFKQDVGARVLALAA